MSARALVLAALVLAACSGSPAPARVLTRGDLVAELRDGALRVTRGGEEVLVSNAGERGGSADPLRAGDAYAPFAAAQTRARAVDEVFGFFDFQETATPFAGLTPQEPRVEGDRLVFGFAEGGEGFVSIEDDGAVHVGWSVPEALGDRLAMTFACRPGERFFGMGAQVSAEHHGYRVPIWTSEQGVGKADRGETTPVFGVVGNYYDSYAPLPFALSSRPLGLWLDSTRRSTFDLCEDDARLRVEAQGPRFDLWLFPASSMAGALEAFTARTGRFQPVPRWTFAPWVDAFGGPDGIATALSALRDAAIPASALWAEDWVGTMPALGGENLTYDWQEDETRYPDLAATAAAIHRAGLRFLVYLNPYVPEDAAARAELAAVGGLTKDADGNVMTISFPFGSPMAWFDPTAQAARDVYWSWLDRAVDEGVDGWMADYGEELPYDAVLADGRTGAEAHNDYPRLWALANREYWAQRRPDRDYGMFSRSGFTGASSVTRVMWLGDQLTTFDRNDGLGSVLPLYLSAGLSGISVTHSDVGGYTSAPGHARTYELFARWLTLEAFTPVLRTHHSSAPADAVQWWSDATTRALFARYARWHQRLVPYWTMLAAEAHTDGVPAVRPVWWGSESRADLFDVEDEALVGADLLLAPILAAGGTAREVRLPPGAWRRWSDAFVPLGPAQSGTVEAQAALEDAVLFVRAGAAIPLLTEDYDTLAPPRPDAPVDDALDVAPARIETLRLLLVGGGSGEGALSDPGLAAAQWRWDGDAIAGGPLEAVRVGGRALDACAAPGAVGCLDGDVARLGPDELAGAPIEVDAGGATGTLTMTSDARWVEIEVR